MQDNKLIAEFMGLPEQNNAYENPYSGEYIEAIELSYDESWDWLMPVILKLSPLTECGIKIQRNETIESAYSFVVKFIKEHNEVDRLVYLSKYTCDSCGDRTDRVAFNEDKDINECMDCI